MVILLDVYGIYPLVMTNSLLCNMAIEIVDFPMKNCHFPQLEGMFNYGNYWKLKIMVLTIVIVYQLVQDLASIQQSESGTGHFEYFDEVVGISCR